MLKLEFQNILDTLRQSKMDPIVPKTTSNLLRAISLNDLFQIRPNVFKLSKTDKVMKR